MSAMTTNPFDEDFFSTSSSSTQPLGFGSFGMNTSNNNTFSPFGDFSNQSQTNVDDDSFSCSQGQFDPFSANAAASSLPTTSNPFDNDFFIPSQTFQDMPITSNNSSGIATSPGIGGGNGFGTAFPPPRPPRPASVKVSSSDTLFNITQSNGKNDNVSAFTSSSNPFDNNQSSGTSFDVPPPTLARAGSSSFYPVNPYFFDDLTTQSTTSSTTGSTSTVPTSDVTSSSTSFFPPTSFPPPPPVPSSSAMGGSGSNKALSPPPPAPTSKGIFSSLYLPTPSASSSGSTASAYQQPPSLKGSPPPPSVPTAPSSSSHIDRDEIERLRCENAWLNDLLISKVEALSRIETESNTYKEDVEKQLIFKEEEKAALIARARERLQNWQTAYNSKEDELQRLKASHDTQQAQWTQERSELENTIQGLKQSIDDLKRKVSQSSIEYKPDMHAFTNMDMCERALISIEQARVEITQVKVCISPCCVCCVVSSLSLSPC